MTYDTAQTATCLKISEHVLLVAIPGTVHRLGLLRHGQGPATMTPKTQSSRARSLTAIPTTLPFPVSRNQMKRTNQHDFCHLGHRRRRGGEDSTSRFHPPHRAPHLDMHRCSTATAVPILSNRQDVCRPAGLRGSFGRVGLLAHGV